MQSCSEPRPHFRDGLYTVLRHVSAVGYELTALLIINSIDKIKPYPFIIPSKFFWIGFIICDAVSIAIQTVGGAKISESKNYAQLRHGASVARSGIIFQFSNTVFFIVLLVVTMIVLRIKRVTLTSVVRWPVSCAMCVSTLMMLIRNGYRIVELSDGWTSHLMRTELYLIGLDMVPIALAIGIFVLFPPTFLLGEKDERNIER